MNLNYKKLNTLVGWFVFLIAAYTYLSTIEPNFSFWDCGEYISSAVKLQVTHSPGAVFFQILGAVWAILAMGDPTKYSIVINSLSALLSALTILFLFWTITHMARKVLFPNTDPLEYTNNQKFIILLSGTIGALCFTFTDTFWFSAVEGEVYAAASCFTALLLWLICKWENDIENPRANRWLILISLIIGLSVGVHLMVILVVPTIGYIYYAKKYKFTWKNFIIANLVVGGVFIFVFKIIFPFTMQFFGTLEIFFVNGFNLPFNTGSIIALIILIAVFYYALKLTIKHNLVTINTIVLSILFMLIGFSSWTVLPIRALANPPINLNDPDNAIGMLDYYNRAQYGDWPIFYGANYTAYLDPNGIVGTVNNGPIYEKNEKEGKYIVTGSRFDYKFNPEQVSFLPRMFSPDPSAMENYGLMEGYPNFTLNPQYAGNPEAEKAFQELVIKKTRGNISIDDYQQAKKAELINVKKPSFGQNFDFMMTYQMGYMFVRYFLWNFVGKQNDIQGSYENTKGNWISGVKPIDNMRLGDQNKLPPVYKNKATNTYYFLPLILGLIGFFLQLNRDPGRNFALIALFLLTSVGIILYTSIKAFEPRERDYALVSSFYTFCIWIGLGVTAILQAFNKLKMQKIGILAGFLMLGVPILMGYQNWDDHDRSRRYTAYDFSKSYLEGLDHNYPILFTYGDNDTYPLWALQETEEFRSDAKVINFTLLGTAWYNDQVYRKTYKAPGLPSSLSHEEYRDGVNDQVILFSNTIWKKFFSEEMPSSQRDEFPTLKDYVNKDSLSAKEAINFLKNEEAQKELKDLYSYAVQGDYNYKLADDTGILPVNKIYIPVNKANALKYGIVRKEDANLMVDKIMLNIKKNSLGKEGLGMLNLFANYNWDRSIYFSSGGTYSQSNLMYTQDYLEYQGLVSKLVPIYTPDNGAEDQGRINLNNIYRLVMNYKFGNLKDPKAYFDETCRGNIVNYRMACGRAAIALAEAGEKKKAQDVLDLINKEIPLKLYPATPSFNSIISAYFFIGNEKEGLKLAQVYKDQVLEELNYYLSLPAKDQTFVKDDMANLSRYYTFIIDRVANNYIKLNQKDKAIQYIQESLKPFDERLKDFEMKGKNNANQNRASVENLFYSYGLMLQVLTPMDSVYAQEVSEKLDNFAMKLE